MSEQPTPASQRVLVNRIGRLGDTILATAVVEALQRALGGDVLIDFTCSPGAPEFLLKMDRRVNRVFAIAHRSVPWRIHPAKRALESHSRQFPYDLVINLECGDECDDLIDFVHCHAFYGRPKVQPAHQPGRHCVDTEKTIYAPLLGAAITAAAEPSLQLALEAVALPYPRDARTVVLNPGFSGIGRPGYRSHRGWPLEHWHELVKSLTADDGFQVLINGTEREQQHFQSLLQISGVVSLFGSSLPVLAAALSQARCLVSVDTGTMHLAAALRTPVIALFGPSNPSLTGPYSKTVSHRVLLSGVDCQPCVNTAQQRKCAVNRCMSGLKPGQVRLAVQQVVGA